MIIQIIIAYYYVFIALALIFLIICYIRYNHRSQPFQLKYPFKNKEITSTGYTNSEETADKSCYHSEEKLSPEAYQNELDIESKNVEKGNKFERYVVDKFNDTFF